MKKFKKIIAMCLATVMAMSVMCVGAFAAPSTEAEPIRTGELPNGVIYEVYSVDSETAIPFSLSSWTGTVTVPLRNEAGTSGVILGGRSTFVPAPHNRYYVEVGNLPSTMPTVNVGLRLADQSASGYTILNANEAIVFVIPDSLIYDSWVATASTDELYSRSATFTCFTFAE